MRSKTFPIVLEIIIVILFYGCYNDKTQNRYVKSESYSSKVASISDSNDVAIHISTPKNSFETHNHTTTNFKENYNILEHIDTFTADYNIKVFLYDNWEDTIYVKTCFDCEKVKFPNKTIAIIWENIYTQSADTVYLTNHRLLNWCRKNIKDFNGRSEYLPEVGDNWISIWGLWEDPQGLLKNDTLSFQTSLNIPDTDASISFSYLNWHFGDSIIYEHIL